MDTTGDRIRIARKAAGLTQTELAEKLGLKFSVISKYETGRVVNLKRENIDEIAKVLNVRPSWLMCMDDEKENQPVAELDEDRIKLFKLITNLPKDQVKMLEAQIQVYLQNQEDQDV